MDIIEYITKYLNLLEGDVDESRYIVIENCGQFNEELDGIKVCFDKTDEQKIIEMAKVWVSGEQEVSHFVDTFKVSPIDLISFPKTTLNTSFTESLLNHYNSLEEMCTSFGIEWIKSAEQDIVIDDVTENVIAEEEDIIIDDVYDNTDFEAKEYTEETIPSSYEKEINNEEESVNLLTESKLNNVNDIEECEISDLVHEDEGNFLDSETGIHTDSNSFSEEESNNEEVTKPPINEESSYNKMNEEDNNATLNAIINGLPEAQKKFEELMVVLTGRKIPRSEYMSEEDFKQAKESLNNLSPSEFKKVMFIVINRFWRFGEVELISRLVKEIIHYYEENSDE